MISLEQASAYFSSIKSSEIFRSSFSIALVVFGGVKIANAGIGIGFSLKMRSIPVVTRSRGV